MVWTSAVLTTLLCSVLVGMHLYYDTLKPTSWQHLYTTSPVHNNPVLSALQAARVNNNSSSSVALQPVSARHDMQCCRIKSMSSVLAAAAGFRNAAASLQAAGSPSQEARELLLLFRSQFAKVWAAELQHVVSQNLATGSSSSKSSSNNCRCRSVQLLAARQPRSSSNSSRGNTTNDSNEPTALLLVLNSWDRLNHQLQLYSANLLMLWSYARLHGYGLHVYVHGADLPPWMPVYFIKPAGILHTMQDLGYHTVLYMDWDMLISPHTAPPLSLFYNEFPSASLLQQGEYNLCAGVNLWRNTADGRALLHAWWELGAAGCCPTTQHDQSALKHIVSAYIANLTGELVVYGPRAQQLFKLPAALPPPAAEDGSGFAVLSQEAPPTAISTWIKLRPVLQQKASAIGLVGLNVHYRQDAGHRPTKLAFTSCMGLWWGCVPPDTPALLYHTGHGSIVSSFVATCSAAVAEPAG